MRASVFVLTCLMPIFGHANSSSVGELIESMAKKLDESKQTNSQKNDSLTLNSGIPIGEELFLSVFLERYYLGDLFAIKSEGRFKVEFRSFVEILDFAIENQKGNWVGWYINEKNAFSLNVLDDSYQVVLPKGIFSYSKVDKFQFSYDELYVDVELLEYWFDLNLKEQLEYQRVYLVSQNKLPIQDKLSRSNRTLPNRDSKSDVIHPWKESPYEFSSPPLVDIQVSASKTEITSSSAYSILGTQDFAYANLEYFFAGNNTDALNESRIKLSRESAEQDLLWGLKATSIEAGDIIPTKVGANSLSDYGRGLRVSNKDLNQQNADNNKVIISGPVQNNWDVELHRNGVLVAQQLNVASGQYRFDNVELFVGQNTFELIMYGPQGQVQTKSLNYYVDGVGLEVGESNFDVSVSEYGERLFDNRNISEKHSGWLTNASYQYAFSNNGLLRFGLSNFAEKDNKSLQLLAFGIDLSLKDLGFINFDYEVDSSENSDIAITYRNKLLSQDMRASINYEKSKDQINSNDLDLLNFNLDLQGESLSGNWGRFSYRNQFKYTSIDDISTLKYNNSLNYSFGRSSIQNAIEVLKPEEGENIISGTTRFQTRLGSFYTRFTSNYNVRPYSEFVSHELEINRSLYEDWQVELSIQHFPSLEEQNYELGINWLTDTVSVNSNIGYDSNKEWQASIFLRFGIGYDPVYNSYFSSFRSLSQNGVVIARVFVDANGDTIYNDGEQLLNGVKVKSVHSYRHGYTDENGIAVLSGLTNNLKTDIELDKNTFKDAFMIPAIDGLSITPRKGYVEYIDFPVVYAGEVEGTVVLKGAEDENVQPYTNVELVDNSGEVIAKTKSEYDGYFLFTDLKPGDYQVRVQEAQLESKAVRPQYKHIVKLSAKGDVLSEVNLPLLPKEFVAGDVLSIGEFKSENILKVYFKLVSKKFDLSSYKPFYIKDNNTYILALDYQWEDNMKEDFLLGCDAFTNSSVNCKVRAVNLAY